MHLAALILLILSLSPSWGYSFEDDPVVYLGISLIGSEPDGPKQTETSDYDLFIGYSLTPTLGIAAGVGRLEAEWFDHRIESGYYSSNIEVTGWLLNAAADIPITKRWRISPGVTVGSATVDVDQETCLDAMGCTPVVTHDSGSATVYGWSIGIGVLVFNPQQDATGELTLGFRSLRSGALGIKDEAGTPFEKDNLDLSMSWIGWRWYFPSLTLTPHERLFSQ